MAPKATAGVQEKQWFIEDPKPLDDNSDKNAQLGELLDGPWSDLAVVSIRRIEIGSSPGWEVTHRK
jgi:hypothetical protein